MGLAKDFNKVLQDEVRIQAAWLPITNSFEVKQKVQAQGATGNIRDL